MGSRSGQEGDGCGEASGAEPEAAEVRFSALLEALAIEAGGDPATAALPIGGYSPAWEPDAPRSETGSALLYGPPNSGQTEALVRRALELRSEGMRLMVVTSGLPASRSLAATLSMEAPGLAVAELARLRSRKAGPVMSARADLVIATPENLHRDVLPDRYRFGALLESLAEVWVWDLTSMRGLLGSHLHHILARLEHAVRADYGREIAFAATASELGDPERFFETLLRRPARRIRLTRPEPTRLLVAMVDPARMAESKAPATIASAMAAAAASSGERVLILTQSRLQAELIAGYTLDRAPEELAGRVVTYRGGYLEETRVELEQLIERQDAAVVASTSALPEGVGNFDVLVEVGFPGVLSRFRRDLARLRGRVGLGIFIAESDLLDSWMTAHSEELGVRPNEQAAINPWNQEVLLYQLACASSETAVDPGEWAGGDAQTAQLMIDAFHALQERRQVAETPDGYVFTGATQPQRNRSLRGKQHRRYLLVTRSGEVLEELDEERIASSAYLGAVYRHRGGRYLVTAIDEHTGTVMVDELEEPVHTKVITESHYRFYEAAELGRAHAGVQAGTCRLAVLEMHVGHEVIGDDGTLRGVVESRLPPRRLDTDALFMVFGGELEATMDSGRLPGALHAFEHTAIGVLGLVAICDRWDVGGVSSPAVEAMMPGMGISVAEPQGLVAIYDGAQGGSGIADLAYHRLPDLARATLSVLETCPCERGCPSCIVSPKCGNNNEPLSKAGAMELARALVAGLDPSGPWLR
ncbi:MAG: DUF1998 domain-containing protein [Actinomycetota bacterium]|nr:DUF1998 domain-containing protein [Actinomycetota bacterium]MDA8209764.1 DUF1998 domain-containing protein [Actinomycetota bacterium]